MADSYASQTSVSIGRILSARWFAQGIVGVGLTIPIHEDFNPSRGLQSEFGGSVGYKFKAHTFLASYTRAVGDVYGLGSNATDSSSGAWRWNRPFSRLSVNSSFGYSHLIGSAFPNAGSWTARASIGRALQSHFFMSATYSYAQFPEYLVARAPNLEFTGVAVGISWLPSQRQ